jgi:hypothetical protein
MTIYAAIFLQILQIVITGLQLDCCNYKLYLLIYNIVTDYAAIKFRNIIILFVK